MPRPESARNPRPEIEEESRATIARLTISDSDFAEPVTVMQDAAGDIYQVAPRFSSLNADALTSYRFLRDENPSPYMFYIDQKLRTFRASRVLAPAFGKDPHRHLSNRRHASLVVLP